MVEIRSDIPPPPRANNGRPGSKGGRPPVYPWADMKPGDSVFLPGKANASAISSSLGAWRRKHSEQQFATKQENGGLRVWRIT